MKKLYLIVLLLAATSLFAQKRQLIIEYDEVVKTAKEELAKAMKGPDGELYLYVSENNLSGKYNIDISLHEKGKVATVFIKERDGGSIKSQNLLRDFLKDMRFPFKMPKGKDYKFNYTFNFNNQ